jgi:MATE family multidrug resistance protein
MLGLSQAVSVLVGRRLGENRPEVAERTGWAGFRVAALFMGSVALSFYLVPQFYVAWFRNERDPLWPQVAVLVPVLLRFVAVYSLFDSMTLIFSFALRGAGDTRFVTRLSLILAWPIMVVPTWAAYEFGWGVYWAWAFASAYVITLGVIFLLRFRNGAWKSMRVIEMVPVADESEVEPRAEGLISVCLQGEQV